jgi:hypothetical protein
MIFNNLPTQVIISNIWNKEMRWYFALFLIRITDRKSRMTYYFAFFCQSYLSVYLPNYIDPISFTCFCFSNPK